MLIALRVLALSAIVWSVVAEPATPLKTIELATTTVAETRWFDGTVEAVNRATVSAQISARVIEIGFDVDQFVEAGAVIVRFDPTDAKAAYAQAQAALAEAVATRDGAEREFVRLERLYANRTVSRAQFDVARTSFDAAKARADAATALVSRSTEQLQYTEVTAPYSGLVVARHVELGELASPGQPLMTGISLDELRVSTEVPQQIVGKLRASVAEHVALTRVVLDDGQRIEAGALTVFPVANAQTHTVTVRAALPSGTRGLYPGMLVRIGFDVGVDERLLVPEAALVRRGELLGVYRVDADDRVVLQQVRAGRSYGDDRIEVVSGLHTGDRIALDPLEAMRQHHPMGSQQQ